MFNKKQKQEVTYDEPAFNSRTTKTHIWKSDEGILREEYNETSTGGEKHRIGLEEIYYDDEFKNDRPIKKSEGVYFLDGQKMGVWKFWDIKGRKLKVENYNDHLRKDGEWPVWYENGILKSVSTYKDGKLNGESSTWYEDGKQKTLKTYEDDFLNGVSKTWYENGKLKTSETYEDDFLNGVSKTWYENGVLRTEIDFEDDLVHGVFRSWFENGNKCVVSHHKNKRMGFSDGNTEYWEMFNHGSEETWHENGELKTKIIYDMDRKVLNENYDENGTMLNDVKGSSSWNDVNVFSTFSVIFMVYQLASVFLW